MYENQLNNLASCQKSVVFFRQLDQIMLYDFDMYMFLIFSSIGLAMNLIIIVLNIMYPMMRKRPGDLFCGLAVAESLLSAHWIISAANQKEGDGVTAVRSDDVFCTLNAAISVIGGQMEFFYNLLIYAYVICAVRNMRIVKIVKTWSIHLTVGVASVLFMIIMEAWSQLGKTLFGTCSLKSKNTFPLNGVSLLLMYIFFSYSTLLYLNFKLPRIQKYQDLLGFYSKYMLTCITIWSVIVVCQIMVYLNCQFIHAPYVNIFITIGNISKVATTIVLPIIRITDPNVKLVFRLINLKKKRAQIALQRIKAKREKANEIAASSMNLDSSISMNQGIRMNLYNRGGNNKSTENENSQEIEMIDFQQSSASLDANEYEQLAEYQSVEGISLEDFQNDDTANRNPNIARGKKQSDLSVRGRPVRRGGVSGSVRPSVELSGNFYESLSNSMRESILFRMIAGILLSDKRKYKNFKIDITSIRGTSIFDQKKIYQFNDKLIQEQVHGMPEKVLEIHQFEDIRMTSFSPLLFQSLIERDRVDIQTSLNLVSNRDDISLAADEQSDQVGRFETTTSQSSVNPIEATFAKLAAGGGSFSSTDSSQDREISHGVTQNSGAAFQKERNSKVDDYFFFSNDKQLILKTVSNQQLKIFLEMIKDYYNHIKLNPQSLLMRVYGIFSFKGIESSDISVILMKNAAPCPPAFIHRRYDLKGSTIQRQVLSSYPEKNSDGKIEMTEALDLKYRGLLLKDIDFNELERTIDVSQSDKEGLMQILERDVLFLLRNGMMNYSLVVIKVDWERYVKEYLPSMDQSASRQTLLQKYGESVEGSQLLNGQLETRFVASALKSTKEPGVFYMFGIIDFLHRYTILKRIARIYKMAQYRTTELDISSTDPVTYSHRFLSYCKRIIQLSDVYTC